VPALDRLLSVYDHHEAHEIEVDSSPERAVATFLALDPATGIVTRALLGARGVGTAQSIEALLDRIGFVALHRTPTEVVLGAAGRPWTARGGIGPFAAARPGEVRVAVDVRAVALDGGRSRLSTETRIAAVDERARRAFGRYWRVVGPFSGVIRKRWLRGAKARLDVTTR